MVVVDGSGEVETGVNCFSFGCIVVSLVVTRVGWCWQLVAVLVAEDLGGRWQWVMKEEGMWQSEAVEMMFLGRVSSTLKPLQRSRFFSSNSGYDFSKAIQELNKEMESVFGEPPTSSLSGSIDNQSMAQDLESAPTNVTQSISSSGLTHIDSKGEAQMVDISPKEITKRVAVASCKVILGQKVFDLVSANQMEKGDVLGVAKIAGICGAKQTSNLIPLCHIINLTHVALNLTLNPRDLCVEIESEAASNGKTGVEMEALTAVTIAGLTVYDMCKAASKDILITDVQLESKSGGKSGDWLRKK
ncbi:Cyclic pyranopterin monophosphate synthase acCES [Forsythia ovata]|uniref:cyclic pyranopterin monophosphate synthase n=1 Tax=Forsythia ovata TaxID=205694 RepID=A0ABD1Q103_9LAMI